MYSGWCTVCFRPILFVWGMAMAGFLYVQSFQKALFTYWIHEIFKLGFWKYVPPYWGICAGLHTCTDVRMSENLAHVCLNEPLSFSVQLILRVLFQKWSTSRPFFMRTVHFFVKKKEDNAAPRLKVAQFLLISTCVCMNCVCINISYIYGIIKKSSNP